MFDFLKKLFTDRQKKIVFIDGDQSINLTLAAYDKYFKRKEAEVYFIRNRMEEQAEPKNICKRNDIKRIYITSKRARKEAVDKFISGYIQRAISEKYTEITVISDDADFVDIFQMAPLINPRASEVKFRIISPKPFGRMNEDQPGIEIIRGFGIKQQTAEVTQ